MSSDWSRLSGGRQGAADADTHEPGFLHGKRLPFHHNAGWLFGGTAVFSVAQWGLIAALAKEGNAAAIGVFVLAQAVTGPLIWLARLQLRNILATDTAEKHPFADYFQLQLITAGAAACVIPLGAALLSGPDSFALLLLLMGLVRLFDSLSELVYGLLQRDEWMKRIGISMVIRGVVGFLAFVAVYITTTNLLAAVLALLVSRCAVLLLYDVASVRKVSAMGALGGVTAARLFDARSLESGAARSLIRAGLPLGMASMLITLIDAFPRYAIAAFLGPSELGIFAAIIYFSYGGSLVVEAVSQAALPRLARSYASGDRAAFLRVVLKLSGAAAAVGVVGLCGAVVVGEPLLSIIYGPMYADYSILLVKVMAATTLLYIGTGLWTAVTGARHFRVQFPAFGTIAIVAGTSSFIFIPSMGLDGAVLALAMTGITQVGISARILSRASSRLPRESV